MFQKKSGMENFYAEEGDLTIFCWNFFFLTVLIKFREGNHSRFQNYSGMEKVYAEGDITFLC